MTKLFLSILVLFALVAILYFAFSKQIGERLLGSGNPIITPQPQVVERPVTVTQPTPTSLPEDDLTALDTDLSALQESDTTLGQDLNSL